MTNNLFPNSTPSIVNNLPSAVELPNTKSGAIAIVGRPNVGKSTLLNTLIGQKIAMVSEKPQTTRSKILGVGHFSNGQLAFFDTPGLHRPEHRLNKRMVRASLETLRQADIVYAMVEAKGRPDQEDYHVLRQIASMIPSAKSTPIFLLINKIDLLKKAKLLPFIDTYRAVQSWDEIIPLSAKTGNNLNRLVEMTLSRLPIAERQYEEDFITDQPMRQMAAEIIREQVIHQTYAELPYVVAVTVQEFTEEGRLARIAASIIVEKESQKPIVIGKGGLHLKAIGTRARQEMEKIFEMKVFLDLRVKTRPSWRDDDRFLTELGC